MTTAGSAATVGAATTAGFAATVGAATAAGSAATVGAATATASASTAGAATAAGSAASDPAGNLPEGAAADALEPDPWEQVERRAGQIAQLIWEEREEGLPNLVSRILAMIFDQSRTPQDQNELSHHLISSLTGHMLSYPFVSDSHLPHVPDSLSFSTDIPASRRQEHLKEALDALCQDFSAAVKKLRNPYVLAAQEYIRENYSNPVLSLEEIAEHLKIAPNYLSTVFSKSLGIKLFEYINEYRLEKSIQLLLNTDKTINDISNECGFGSSRNYIRIFKKYKENTPGAYRKQHHPRG